MRLNLNSMNKFVWKRKFPDKRTFKLMWRQLKLLKKLATLEGEALHCIRMTANVSSGQNFIHHRLYLVKIEVYLKEGLRQQGSLFFESHCLRGSPHTLVQLCSKGSILSWRQNSTALSMCCWFGVKEWRLELVWVPESSLVETLWQGLSPYRETLRVITWNCRWNYSSTRHSRVSEVPRHIQ